VVLFDPSYANYGPQLDVGPDGVEVVRLPVLDQETWSWIADPSAVLDAFTELLERHTPKLLLLSSPDNPTSRVVPDELFFQLLDAAAEASCFVIADFAYRTQCWVEGAPAHFSASPATYPNLIRLHSNSKWCRGLGRRIGWVEAAPDVVEALEIVQQSTALCPDSVHQHALATYLDRALDDGSLQRYLAETNELYRGAGEHTVRCVREYLRMPCLDPEGGLYTVVDVGRDGDDFARDVLPRTGVILVPGSGFGPTLTNGVRISYGPLVRDLDRIEEGLRRVGELVRA